MSLNKQANHGLYYIVSYTYAHALDNGSSFESSGFGNGNDIAGTNWVPGFNQLSYGNSEYDARHTFRAGYGYLVPLFPAWKQHYLVNQAIGGWHLTGITTLQSGNPVSIGESGFIRSLWCNGAEPYSFYECPDTPMPPPSTSPTRTPAGRTISGSIRPSSRRNPSAPSAM